MMNQVLSKVVYYGGAVFCAFVYGAGAYSVAKHASDMRDLKKRMDKIEDKTYEIASKHNDFVGEIFDEFDKIEDRFCDLETRSTAHEINFSTICQQNVNAFSEINGKLDELADFFGKVYDENKDEKPEENDENEEECCEKKCKKSTKTK